VAEGLADGQRDNVEREALETGHTNARLESEIALSAETGMIKAVLVTGENDENDDEQDASRRQDETHPARRSPQTATQAEFADLQGGIALIIEDSAEVADVMTVILRRMGMTTAHESHGVRAFERFTEMHPHVVLLDLSLPDITGWRVLDAIREQQRETENHMPAIIVTTAYGDPANRLVAKLQGVYAYLVKPFTADELTRVVRDAMSEAR